MKDNTEDSCCTEAASSTDSKPCSAEAAVVPTYTLHDCVIKGCLQQLVGTTKAVIEHDERHVPLPGPGTCQDVGAGDIPGANEGDRASEDTQHPCEQEGFATEPPWDYAQRPHGEDEEQCAESGGRTSRVQERGSDAPDHSPASVAT